MIYLAATVFPAPLSPLQKKKYKNAHVSFKVTLQWDDLKFILSKQGEVH